MGLQQFECKQFIQLLIVVHPVDTLLNQNLTYLYTSTGGPERLFTKSFQYRRPITWSIFNPGVELSPVDRVEILYDYMKDFNPGVEMIYVPAILFLVINSHYRAYSNSSIINNFSPGLKRLHDKIFNPKFSTC